MAVSIKSFDDWYVDRREDGRGGCLEFRGLTPAGSALAHQFDKYEREHRSRISDYDKLLAAADGEVITRKKDLPNVSSGESAGMIRRMARNLVQHTPNVDVICAFDDDSAPGVFARWILKSKIIGDDEYSNDMQQNLFATAKMALSIGFDCVIPVLMQDSSGTWKIKYDNIYYTDVFPEPGAKDVRDANDVFVRRYLSKNDVKALIRHRVAGWDLAALKLLLKNDPPNRHEESVDHQTKKHRTMPDGYEIITYYSNTGEPFLTFSANSKILLRIEKNKHPFHWHPVHFLVPEKDLQQPLGKSQVELVLGRQEFQDLMLNGAMKLWYRNINPSIIGYGTVNTIPNLSPGKYTEIKNPNAKLEAFEVNTQTLMQFNSISQANSANMVQMVGAADQQMASQSTGGMMSQTPQGVNAQQQMVDITTNNYQKAIEAFFSRYCSYALTIYFQELKGTKKITPSADARRALINGGLDPELFDPKTGELEMDFSKLATEYYVRVVPGSLVEMEDEKQLRILNELFIPLSQAMPALANSGNPEALQYAVSAMQFIIQKQLELSGSAHSTELAQLFGGAPPEQVEQEQAAGAALESQLSEMTTLVDSNVGQLADLTARLQEQIGMLAEGQGLIMQQLGMSGGETPPQTAV